MRQAENESFARPRGRRTAREAGILDELAALRVADKAGLLKNSRRVAHARHVFVVRVHRARTNLRDAAALSIHDGPEGRFRALVLSIGNTVVIAIIRTFRMEFHHPEIIVAKALSMA